MEITKTLNLASSKALFEQNAILWETRDLIPTKRVEELLGEEAVDFVSCSDSDFRMNRQLYSNEKMGIEIGFLTWRGFSLAVTYHNLSILEQGEKYTENLL